MNQQDAMAIMAALEDGHTFEFSNYYDGVREVLEFDPSADQFTLTAHHAYSGDQEQETFTRETFDEWLRKTFRSRHDFKWPR